MSIDISENFNIHFTMKSWCCHLKNVKPTWKQKYILSHAPPTSSFIRSKLKEQRSNTYTYEVYYKILVLNFWKQSKSSTLLGASTQWISSVSHHRWLTPFTACLESAESVFCLPSINTGVPLNSTAKISYFCNLMSILQHGYYFVLSILPLREYWRYK